MRTGEHLRDPAEQTWLFCGVVPFASLRQRPQWLALGMARARRVLYLDPHRSLAHERRLLPALSRVGDRLAVLTPASSLPVTGYARALNRLSFAWTARRVRACLATLGWAPPRVVVTSFPKQIDLVRGMTDARVVYDVMDDYPRFFDAWQAGVLRRMHRELLARADVVVASSRELARRCEDDGAAAVTLLENGVPSAFVEECRSAQPAAELMHLPEPRFGYIGTISSWFDFEAVAALARAFPTGSVVIVGPEETRRPTLPANVHFLGARPHASLPGILRTLQIGLVPFRRSAMIDAVNPVKVYEYLAAGLPILATESTELRRFETALALASAADWPAAATRLLASPPSPEAQRARCRDATWEVRVAALEEVLR